MLEYLLDQGIDLCLCQRSTGSQGKPWHGRARHALSDDHPQTIRRYEGQIDWIIQRTRRPEAPIRAVAPGTGLTIELGEAHHLRRQGRLIGWSRSARHGIAPHQDKKHYGHGSDDIDGTASAHRSRSRSRSMPVASTPARAASGQVCMVATGTAREIMTPAASPKAICEAINHGQSMRALSDRIDHTQHGPDQARPQQRRDHAAPQHVAPRQHGENDRVQQPRQHGDHAMGEHRDDQRQQVEGAELLATEMRHARDRDAGQEVDRIPQALLREHTVESVPPPPWQRPRRDLR